MTMVITVLSEDERDHVAAEAALQELARATCADGRREALVQIRKQWLREGRMQMVKKLHDRVINEEVSNFVSESVERHNKKGR